MSESATTQQNQQPKLPKQPPHPAVTKFTTLTGLTPGKGKITSTAARAALAEIQDARNAAAKDRMKTKLTEALTLIDKWNEQVAAHGKAEQAFAKAMTPYLSEFGMAFAADGRVVVEEDTTEEAAPGA